MSTPPDKSTLKLIALDADDLKVMSAHLQDAVLKIADMAFVPRERRFAGQLRVSMIFAAIVAPIVALTLLDVPHVVLMAGAAWGVYSIRGKGAGDATRVTAGNFLRAVSFAAVLSLITRGGRRQ